MQWTRQENSSTGSKGTLVVYNKMPYRFWRDNSSQSETALRSAVLAQSGSDAIVSMIPWPVPGHQQLGQPVRVRWVPSQHAINLRKNKCGSHAERRLQAEALHIQIEIVCSIEKRSLVAPEYSAESRRCNLQNSQSVPNERVSTRSN